MEIHRYYYLTVKSHSLSAIRSSIYDTTSIFGQPINKNKIENDAFKSASYQVCEKYDITEKKLLVILKKGKSQKWDTD